ncbi:MAG: hypothetical protein ACPG7F_00715 [Aggregatilineales bacterium]
MASTYDISTDIGKVRFYSGDRHIDDAWLSDEEIQMLLDTHTGKQHAIKLAAMDVISAILRDMRQTGTIKSDWLSVDYKTAVMELQKEWQALALATGAISFGATAKPVYRADSLQTGVSEDWES